MNRILLPKQAIFADMEEVNAAKANPAIKMEKTDTGFDLSRNFPEDLLKKLFMCCDISTRCKLRRVSRYWKYLVNLNEVNQVVFIDASCLLVSSNRSTPALGFGWNVPEYYLLTFPYHLPDHQRYGFLGPHVSHIVYDGKYQDLNEAVRNIIRSVGMYCINVTNIILRHVLLLDGGLDPLPFKRQIFQSNWHEPEPRFPRLTSLTLVQCRILSYWHYGHDYYEIKSNIPFLTNHENEEINIPDRAILDRYIWPFPDHKTLQFDWIQKYAPQVPRIYSEYRTLFLWPYTWVNGSYKLFADQSSGRCCSLLRIATFLILREHSRNGCTAGQSGK